MGAVEILLLRRLEEEGPASGFRGDNDPWCEQVEGGAKVAMCLIVEEVL